MEFISSPFQTFCLWTSESRKTLKYYIKRKKDEKTLLWFDGNGAGAQTLMVLLVREQRMQEVMTKAASQDSSPSKTSWILLRANVRKFRANVGHSGKLLFAHIWSVGSQY